MSAAVLAGLAGAALHEARAATDTVVMIRGDVVPSCEVAGLASSAVLGNLTASGTLTLGFSTTCNAPFAYSLASAYGGLRPSSGSSAPPGFSARVPYAVRTIIPTDAGTIDQTCASTAIPSGAL